MHRSDLRGRRMGLRAGYGMQGTQSFAPHQTIGMPTHATSLTQFMPRVVGDSGTTDDTSISSRSDSSCMPRKTWGSWRNDELWRILRAPAICDAVASSLTGDRREQKCPIFHPNSTEQQY